jgi:3-oxoacyl-[acyl-carrier protein] reductase
MSNTGLKAAIITGAARGIGASVAERLASDGFAVIINYPSDATQAEALAQMIEKAGGARFAFKPT